jgi:Fe-S-cluster containining protein
MAEDAWKNAVSDVLLRVSDGCSLEETGCRLAAAACEMGEYMVQKVELAQGLEGASACTKGCSLCCHAQVPVSKPEGEFLAVWMTKNFTTSDCADIRSKVAHNLKLTHGCSLEERLTVWDQTPCVFLCESVCRVYPARPLVCRAWHSIDQDQCLQAFKARTTDSEIDNTPYRNYVLGVVRDELTRLMPWPKGGVLSLPEAMTLCFSQESV